MVRHRVQSSAKDGTAYYVVVEFVDARGSRHTFEARSSGVKGLPVGGGIPVRYLPDTPQAAARIDLTRRRIGDVAFRLAGGSLFTAKWTAFMHAGAKDHATEAPRSNSRPTRSVR
uniref:DUF3592 domain-containing protein n=1 Tax=Peterkaempfera podocarpi TaxID=3232308 RepID=UPI003F5775BE